MNEIAVIRRTLDDARAALDVIRTAFPVTIDAHRWSHLRLDRVDSDGQVTAFIGEVPIDELRAVVFLGAPSHGKPEPSREEVYLQLEREQTLLAALAASVHVKVVNRGYVFAWNRGVYEPPSQLRTLAKLGWRTPSVTQSIDLDTDDVRRLRDPEPDPATQDLLVIGLRRHVRVGGSPVAGLEQLVARTQLHMRGAGLDLVTVPIALTREGPVAFGLHPGISAEAPAAELVTMLHEAVEA